MLDITVFQKEQQVKEGTTLYEIARKQKYKK